MGKDARGLSASQREAIEHFLPEPLASVETPSGGRHLYYREPPDGEQVGQGKWEQGVLHGDTRHCDGYVVLWDPNKVVAAARRAKLKEHGGQFPLAVLRPVAAKPKAAGARPAPVIRGGERQEITGRL